MKPTAQQYKAILKKALLLKKEEDRIDKAFGMFVNAVCPSQYATFIESTMISSFTDGLELIFPGITADISYWIYEVPSISKREGKCVCKDRNGNVYDAANLGSYVKFLLAQ